MQTPCGLVVTRAQAPNLSNRDTVARRFGTDFWDRFAQTSRNLASTTSQLCPRFHPSQGRSNGAIARRCQRRQRSRRPRSSISRTPPRTRGRSFQASMLATSAERQHDIDSFIWASQDSRRLALFSFVRIDSSRLGCHCISIFAVCTATVLLGPACLRSVCRPIPCLRDHASQGRTRRPPSRSELEENERAPRRLPVLAVHIELCGPERAPLPRHHVWTPGGTMAGPGATSATPPDATPQQRRGPSIALDPTLGHPTPLRRVLQQRLLVRTGHMGRLARLSMPSSSCGIVRKGTRTFSLLLPFLCAAEVPTHHASSRGLHALLSPRTWFRSAFSRQPQFTTASSRALPRNEDHSPRPSRRHTDTSPGHDIGPRTWTTSPLDSPSNSPPRGLYFSAVRAFLGPIQK